ncbi:MAG: LpxD N-terminal domain-containing protein, partial [Endomicrobiia bacterium]
MKLKNIVKLVNGELKLPRDKIISEVYKIEITGINSLKYATQNELSFFSSKKYFSDYLNSKSEIVCVEKKFFKENFLKDKILILVDDIKKSMSLLIENFYVEQSEENNIHKTVVIEDTAVIDKNVSIGEYTVIKHNTHIGSGTKIGSLCYIGKNVIIGNNCRIYPLVKILDGSVIGDNVIIHSGTVIGSDGFGYITEGARRRGSFIRIAVWSPML